MGHFSYVGRVVPACSDLGAETASFALPRERIRGQPVARARRRGAIPACGAKGQVHHVHERIVNDVAVWRLESYLDTLPGQFLNWGMISSITWPTSQAGRGEALGGLHARIPAHNLLKTILGRMA